MKDELEWAVIVLVSVVSATVVMGFLIQTWSEQNDRDCDGGGPHDERPPACQEFCRDEPNWYVWGHHRVCWWDDNSTVARP